MRSSRRSLAKRMLVHERLQLWNDLRCPAELDVRRDPFFSGDQTQLFETTGLGLRPLLECELGERGAPPQPERPDEQVAAFRDRSATCVGEHLLEAPRVDLVGGDSEEVPGRTRDEHIGPESLPQRDYGVLQRRRRRGRRLRPVELVDELLRRYDATGAQKQRCEQRALTRPSECDRAVVAPHLERAEDPELLHRSRL